jgi:hypothetical protein
MAEALSDNKSLHLLSLHGNKVRKLACVDLHALGDWAESARTVFEH